MSRHTARTRNEASGASVHKTRCWMAVGLRVLAMLLRRDAGIGILWKEGFREGSDWIRTAHRRVLARIIWRVTKSREANAGCSRLRL